MLRHIHPWYCTCMPTLDFIHEPSLLHQKHRLRGQRHCIALQMPRSEYLGFKRLSEDAARCCVEQMTKNGKTAFMVCEEVDRLVFVLCIHSAYSVNLCLVVFVVQKTRRLLGLGGQLLPSKAPLQCGCDCRRCETIRIPGEFCFRHALWLF